MVQIHVRPQQIAKNKKIISNKGGFYVNKKQEPKEEPTRTSNPKSLDSYQASVVPIAKKEIKPPYKCFSDN